VFPGRVLNPCRPALLTPNATESYCNKVTSNKPILLFSPFNNISLVTQTMEEVINVFEEL
jgi:hypothetical protein